MSNMIYKHKAFTKLTTTFPSMNEIALINAGLVNQTYKRAFPEKTFIAIDIEHFAHTRKVSYGEAYRLILDTIKDVRREDLVIPVGGGTMWHTNIIDSYKTNEEEKTISIQWNEEVIEYISGNMVPGTFISSDKRMGATSKKKRYFLYELLCEYIHKKEFTLSLQIIRERCGILAEEYKEFKDLNRRLIIPTLQDIKRLTDVDIEAHKVRGRGIVQFVNRTKKMQEEDKIKKLENELDKVKGELMQVQRYGQKLEGTTSL